jgi:hypothetical protein
LSPAPSVGLSVRIRLERVVVDDHQEQKNICTTEMTVTT